jgi:hypothetical protein
MMDREGGHRRLELSVTRGREQRVVTLSP